LPAASLFRLGQFGYSRAAYLVQKISSGSGYEVWRVFAAIAFGVVALAGGVASANVATSDLTKGSVAPTISSAKHVGWRCYRRWHGGGPYFLSAPLLLMESDSACARGRAHLTHIRQSDTIEARPGSPQRNNAPGLFTP
jgi:hypothetical protein